MLHSAQLALQLPFPQPAFRLQRHKCNIWAALNASRLALRRWLFALGLAHVLVWLADVPVLT